MKGQEGSRKLKMDMQLESRRVGGLTHRNSAGRRVVSARLTLETCRSSRKDSHFELGFGCYLLFLTHLPIQ